MTNREFFELVIELNSDERLIDFAKEGIAKLDARNEKRQSKPSKTAVANEPLKVMICDYLKGKDYITSPVIAVALEISTSKASALCRQLVEKGSLCVKDVHIKNKGNLKGYKLIENE